MKLCLLLILFSLFYSANSFAFKFSPMSASIGVKKDKDNSLFYLENDSDQPIAVQVSIAKRDMDINGVEINSKIGNEINVFPSQLIIPANEKRSVKVFWSGKDLPSKELAYRLIAEQLPIDLEKSKNKKASIKVLLRYMAALYVNANSDDFSSDVNFVGLKNVDKKIAFEFENKGKKHQVLANLHLKIVDEKKKKEISLAPEDLKGMTGENILSESKRIFLLPREGKLVDIDPASKVKISFDKD